MNENMMENEILNLFNGVANEKEKKLLKYTIKTNLKRVDTYTELNNILLNRNYSYIDGYKKENGYDAKKFINDMKKILIANKNVFEKYYRINSKLYVQELDDDMMDIITDTININPYVTIKRDLNKAYEKFNELIDMFECIGLKDGLVAAFNGVNIEKISKHIETEITDAVETFADKVEDKTEKENLLNDAFDILHSGEAQNLCNEIYLLAKKPTKHITRDEER